MKPHRTALLLCPNESFRTQIKAMLIEEGFHVLDAHNTGTAIILLDRTALDLVLIDVERQATGQLQFLRYLKSKFAYPVILISEYSDALVGPSPIAWEASVFLNAPIQKNDLASAISAVLSPCVSGQPIQTEYMKVSSSEFKENDILPYDLYYEPRVGLFEKIASRGQPLSLVEGTSILSADRPWFYMRSQDFALYVGYNVQFDSPTRVPEIERRRKLKLGHASLQNQFQRMRKRGFSSHRLAHASGMTTNALGLMTMNRQTLRLLELMEMAGVFPTHAIDVSLWSCLTAHQLNWSKDALYFVVAFSSLVHDVGANERTKELLNRDVTELTAEEFQLMESHSSQGHNILKWIPGLPEESLYVALQHHELISGVGYPAELKGSEIHPMARLVALANRISEIDEANRQKGELSLHGLFSKVEEFRDDYDPIYFNAFEDLVHSTSQPELPC